LESGEKSERAFNFATKIWFRAAALQQLCALRNDAVDVVLILRFDEFLKENFNGTTKWKRPKLAAQALLSLGVLAGIDRRKLREKCRNPTSFAPDAMLAIAAFSCFLKRGLRASSVVDFAITSWKFSTGRHP
jgi:hypothetical protein